MKENQIDEELMDYVEGVSKNATNEKIRIQGEELKDIIICLKEIPLEIVSSETDERMYKFIENRSAQLIPVINLKRWVPIFTAAASIIILLLVFYSNKSFKDDYQKLSSNPDKLSFIYDMNNLVLSSADIDWLKEELKNEKNPNIKVTIIDLLSKDRSKLDKDVFNNLQYESIPTVQMALLNTLEASENIIFTTELLSFSQRNDLDASVEQKIKDILSNGYK